MTHAKALSAIAIIGNQTQSRISFLITPHQLGCGVRGPVVDNNDFGSQGASVQVRGNAVNRVWQTALLIKRRNNDGEVQRWRIHLQWPRSESCGKRIVPRKT